MKPMKTLYALSLVSLLSISYAWGAPLLRSEQRFANELSQGNLAEVKLGKMIKDKAKSQAVRDFAERMISDHSSLEKDLRKWATKKGATLPNQPGQEEERIYKELSGMEGPELDRKYIRGMLDDHKKDVAKIQKFVMYSRDSELKALLNKTLPILENHLRIAENVAGQLGVEPNKGLNDPTHP